MSKKPRWYLKVRTYPEGRFASVWVCRADGSAHACLLWGEVVPQAVAELAEALGLPLEFEAQPLTGCEPKQPPGCAGVVEQQSLFPEQA